MGLDMYLNRRRYVQNWEHNGPENHSVVTLTTGGNAIPLTNVTYITEQVGYWRKANAVHKFFVDLADSVDECQEIEVSQESLQKLQKLCKAVLKDHSKAEELLPAQSEFFFGPTDYDEYYFSYLKDTLKIIEPLLSTSDDYGVELFYRASW